MRFQMEQSVKQDEMMKSANKTLLHFLFLLGTVICVAGPCFAQSASPSPAAAPAQTVKLTMIATDSANHSVDDVRQEEVQLIENNLPQRISIFSRDVRPVDYALVVDNSGSFRDLIKPVTAAARLIVNGNNPADETFIERFISSDKVQTVVDFTPDKAKLIDALDWFYAEKGQSAVVDGIYLAVSHTAERRNGTADARSRLTSPDTPLSQSPQVCDPTRDRHAQPGRTSA